MRKKSIAGIDVKNNSQTKRPNEEIRDGTSFL